MKRSNLSIALYLCLVFVSGVGVGAFGHQLYTKSQSGPDAGMRRFAAELRSRLNLRDDQMPKLNAVLLETRGRFRELREKYKPEVKAIQQQQIEKISAFLDGNQRAAYEKFRQEQEAERQRQQPKGR